jgi:protein-disulfide isomerase
MKTPPATSQANGKTKVEFLYFKSCPGHKQALVNLRAALKESKINADLMLINVTSEAEAAKVGFQGSPSIRVNGKDLDGRNDGSSYGCRIYQIDGKITPTPTKKFIQDRVRELMR